jgi:plasmid stability protein
MNGQKSTIPYPLRMPDEMRERLALAAKERGRSLHAEIISRLQESLSPTRRMATLEDAIKIFQAEADKMGASFKLIFSNDDKDKL